MSDLKPVYVKMIPPCFKPDSLNIIEKFIFANKKDPFL